MKIVYESDHQKKTMTEYRNQMHIFYNQNDFEWFCSLNLYNDDVELAETFLKVWKRNMSTRDHIRIAYVGNIITSKFTGPHIHLLMFGRNKDGETLLDRNEKEWEREWADVTKLYGPIKKSCGSFIEKVETNFVVRYITIATNTPINHFEPVIPYNEQFLKKYRKNN